MTALREHVCKALGLKMIDDAAASLANFSAWRP